MSGERADGEEMVQLITLSQRSLLTYLLGLLGSQVLAEDALQNTNMILWRKRDEYRFGTNFLAWARQIAYREACHLRRERRRQVPVFSETFMQELSSELADDAIDAPSKRVTFLKECLALLNDQERDLIQRRYADGATTQSVAAALTRSVRSVYRNLQHLHERLFRCIDQKIKDDASAV